MLSSLQIWQHSGGEQLIHFNLITSLLSKLFPRYYNHLILLLSSFSSISSVHSQVNSIQTNSNGVSVFLFLRPIKCPPNILIRMRIPYACAEFWRIFKSTHHWRVSQAAIWLIVLLDIIIGVGGTTDPKEDTAVYIYFHFSKLVHSVADLWCWLSRIHVTENSSRCWWLRNLSLRIWGLSSAQRVYWLLGKDHLSCCAMSKLLYLMLSWYSLDWNIRVLYSCYKHTWTCL